MTVDYSSSHKGRNPPGSSGETGWMFVSQVDKIMEMMPRAVCIEMVANAMNVNEGTEVEIVIAALSERYHVQADVCRVADYGECSNRTRLMIVCFHRDIGDIGAEFEFPQRLSMTKSIIIQLMISRLKMKTYQKNTGFMTSHTCWKKRHQSLYRFTKSLRQLKGWVVLANQMRYRRFMAMGCSQLKPHTMVVGAGSRKDGS